MPFLGRAFEGAARMFAGAGAATARRYGSRRIGGVLDVIGAGERSMGWMAGASPVAQRSIVGAGIGGLYGAAADDTSVLGGALVGAGIGAGSVAGGALGRRGLATYASGRKYGLSRGGAAAAGFGAMGRMARGYIGSSYSRAVNGFRAMGRRGDFINRLMNEWATIIPTRPVAGMKP